MHMEPVGVDSKVDTEIEFLAHAFDVRPHRSASRRGFSIGEIGQ